MLKRSLILVHRWLGVALCLVFLLWFPSGIGMMYWDFPSVSAGDRLERAPALDPSKIVLSPSEAAARLGEGQGRGQVRLNTFDGRPVYRFGGGRGGAAIVYADTGEEQIDVSKEMMDRVAAAWTGQPITAATIEPVEEVDQWTIQSGLRNLRPAVEVPRFPLANRSTSRAPQAKWCSPRPPRRDGAPTLARFRTGCTSPRSENMDPSGVNWSSGRPASAPCRPSSASSSASGCIRRRSGTGTPARRRAFPIAGRNACTRSSD